MEAWTIKLPRQLSERVIRLARKRKVTRSALIREALELLTTEQGKESFVDRISAFVGVADDLPADLSSNPRHLKGYGR
jgi:predicted transcriptional regulator